MNTQDRPDEESDENAFIDLDEVSWLLRQYKKYGIDIGTASNQIIEEVVFLCVNEKFVRDIGGLRKIFIENNLLPKEPTCNFFEVKTVIERLHKSKLYIKSVEMFLRRYHIVSSVYFSKHNMPLSFDISLKRHLLSGNSLKRDDFGDLIEDAIPLAQPSVIDSIIVRNTPYHHTDGIPLWICPNWTRRPSETFSSLSLEMKTEPVAILKMSFPAYASLGEMQAYLRDYYFPKIQELRKERLPFGDNKDYRKKELEKSIDVYVMTSQGKSLTTIARTLDKKYKKEHSFESVRKIMERLKEESNHFIKP